MLLLLSRFLEDGSYFKLRNASLTYNFGNIGNYIKNLNVYVSWIQSVCDHRILRI